MDEIKKYYLQELQKNEAVAELLTSKFERHQDIQDEFREWLSHRDYAKCKLEINGYTAQKIHEINPSFNASGIFSFMVTLRENPDYAKEHIAKGFPTK